MEITGPLGQFLNVTNQRGHQLLAQAVAGANWVSTSTVRHYGQTRAGYDELVAAGKLPLGAVADDSQLGPAEVRMMLDEADQQLLDDAAIKDMVQSAMRMQGHLAPTLVAAAVDRAVAFVQAKQAADDQDALQATRWQSIVSPWQNSKRLPLLSGWAVGLQGDVLGDTNLLDPDLTYGSRPIFAVNLLSSKSPESIHYIMCQWDVLLSSTPEPPRDAWVDLSGHDAVLTLSY